RQSGKTWIMRQVKDKIVSRYGDRFIVGTMSMQGVTFRKTHSDESYIDEFLIKIPRLLKKTFHINVDEPNEWEGFSDIFLKNGIFDRPVILFIDEFDKLPPEFIDRLVNQFRDMYLDRDSYLLHGLALIGVRAVLGVESERGSPFNIQRSMHIPNFTKEEVFELFSQYIEESGQGIDSVVIDKVYEVTRGQPGIVSWFGELITEKYNKAKDKPIDNRVWGLVYNNALTIEWNNTILNLIKKTKKEYQEHVISLFAKSEILFTMDKDWCNYLYMNGVIDNEILIDDKGKTINVCRFSSPFVQERLYNALTNTLVGDSLPILALDILDTLEDVFEPQRLNLPALLQRYKDYLIRLKAKGLNPWKDQPRRVDLNYTEAVGHFHLYAWLQAAIGDECVISPEFPTGNGKVDLHIICGQKTGIIEVKSFSKGSEVEKFTKQAAKYASSLGKDSVTIALFVASQDAKVHEQLYSEHLVGDVKVTVVPIGWTG
ncbi:MAG: hypothetical protein L3V56_13895, partial [Candidatus Magnetoovum sp. WYHC-5]|nr:hypothetical protein [Candidatus Magnetoovum sp. WYHC-5]